MRFSPKEININVIEAVMDLIKKAQLEKKWIYVEIVDEKFYDVRSGRNYIDIDLRDTIEEEEFFKEEIFGDLADYSGYAAIYARYNATARPSESYIVKLYITPFHNLENNYEFTKVLLKLIKSLTAPHDAFETYTKFIQWCSKYIYVYTTRGNKALIKDSGGDYPSWEVIAVYLG